MSKSFGFSQVREAAVTAQRALDEKISQILLEVLSSTADWLRASILAGTLDLVPLRETYVKWKIKQGFDENPLVATEEYVNAIQLRRDSDGTPYVGVPDMPHSGGVSMKDLALFLEFGARSPARPHYEPARQYAISLLRKRLTDEGLMIGASS
jgi:hypothetical protein